MLQEYDIQKAIITELIQQFQKILSGLNDPKDAQMIEYKLSELGALEKNNNALKQKVDMYYTKQENMHC